MNNKIVRASKESVEKASKYLGVDTWSKEGDMNIYANDPDGIEVCIAFDCGGKRGGIRYTREECRRVSSIYEG